MGNVNSPTENEQNKNPFRPAFGNEPTFMVGRDLLMSDITQGLDNGVDDIRYTSIFSGVRGSGKTVLLSTVREQAAKAGWIVLSLDASTEDLLERARHAIFELPHQYDWLNPDALLANRSTTQKWGVKLWGFFFGKKTRTELSDSDHNTQLQHMLRRLLRLASAHGTSVLLTMDEIHKIEQDEARRFFYDIQQLTKSEKWPLAFLGAGLSDMDFTVFEDRALSFFRRCHRYKIPHLSVSESLEGFRSTIQQSGGVIDDAALAIMADNVRGLPYTFQAIGHAAWEHAGAPHNTIDVEAAHHAIEVASDMTEEYIGIPSFYDLDDTERDYLIALARLGDQVSLSDIQQKIAIPPRKRQAADRRLRVSGYITKTKNGTRSLTGLVPRSLILEENDTFPSSYLSAEEHAAQYMPAPVGVCNRWMPRAKTTCVLISGHQGSCRTKR